MTSQKLYAAAVAALGAMSLTGAASAQVTFDRYDNIGGVSVADLTGSAAYQARTPTMTSSLTAFEIPKDVADNYGSDVYGLFTPSQTGDYFFAIASDDASQLFLSTDANPSNAVMIASIDGWGNSREYITPAGDEDAANISGPVPLVAGQSYFIQALQKEGGGGDNLAVTASFGSNTIVDQQDPLGAGATAALGTLTTTPIPEPGTAALALLGLSGLMLRRRGRNA